MKEQIKQFIRYHAIKAWFEKYERWLMPATLLGGVIFDSFTFANIDTHLAFILLGFYVVTSGILIAYMQRYEGGHVKSTGNFFRYLRLTAPFMIQFAFGAMLNATFIFYIFSGSLIVSWPFIVPVTLLMIGNEILRHYHHSRPVVQLSVYYFILFALTSIIIPFLFGVTGFTVFVLCGFVSLGIMSGYIVLLSVVSPTMRALRLRVVVVVAIIFVIMNGLYVANIIPPVPFSIRDITVAHRVTKTAHGYELVTEPRGWWDALFGKAVVHVRPLDRVYIFSSVFAPEHLDTTIVHHWQYYDATAKKWVSREWLSYAMVGGNTTGYRGYSFWGGLTPGKWRVDVTTPRGQVIGRANFMVERVDTLPTTETTIH